MMYSCGNSPLHFSIVNNILLLVFVKRRVYKRYDGMYGQGFQAEWAPAVTEGRKCPGVGPSNGRGAAFGREEIGLRSDDALGNLPIGHGHSCPGLDAVCSTLSDSQFNSL